MFFLNFAFAVTPQDIQARDDWDLLRIEGVYEVNTLYRHLDGQKISKIDRLVVYRNTDTLAYTVALAVDKFQITFFQFDEVKVKCVDEGLSLSAEGVVGVHGIYAEINFIIDRKTLNLKGTFVDSIANGVKEFEGKPLYNLNMCLYQSDDEGFQFPELGELLGEYQELNGKDLLLLRRYTSGALSLVHKKLLSNGEEVNISHHNGAYNRFYGSFSFQWSSEHASGKANVTHRIDEQGRPYLKVFRLSTGGSVGVKKFYFKRKLLGNE